MASEIAPEVATKGRTDQPLTITHQPSQAAHPRATGSGGSTWRLETLAQPVPPGFQAAADGRGSALAMRV